MCHRGRYSPRELYAGGHARELQRRLGGSFPGNPDPATKDWLHVDDEDSGVTFAGGWFSNWNCNGGQYGDRSHYATKPDAKATYPLPVTRPGRYALKGIVPHLFNYTFSPVANIAVRSGGKTTNLVWRQLRDSGFWVDLGELDLEPGATLELSVGDVNPADHKSRWFSGSAAVADGFALAPVR